MRDSSVSSRAVIPPVGSSNINALWFLLDVLSCCLIEKSGSAECLRVAVRYLANEDIRVRRERTRPASHAEAPQPADRFADPPVIAD